MIRRRSDEIQTKHLSAGKNTLTYFTSTEEAMFDNSKHYNCTYSVNQAQRHAICICAEWKYSVAYAGNIDEKLGVIRAKLRKERPYKPRRLKVVLRRSAFFFAQKNGSFASDEPSRIGFDGSRIVTSKKAEWIHAKKVKNDDGSRFTLLIIYAQMLCTKIDIFLLASCCNT